jgi:hypothetical protein
LIQDWDVLETRDNGIERTGKRFQRENHEDRLSIMSIFANK